jgi:biotin carboxylase
MIVIVDPVGSGAELAPAFAGRGVGAIAVRSLPPGALDGADAGGYQVNINDAHFQAVYDVGPDLVEQLRRHNPRAVIPGDESGVELADQLAAALTPGFANVPALSPARRHKARMQAAIAAAGLPAIRTLNTADPAEVEPWLIANGLTASALVLKPALSAGSDNVHHVPPGGDWRAKFDLILSSANKLRGEANETVIVQEMLVGTEYAVDTVSANGEHFLAHLIRYNKTSAGERMTVFDHTEFVPFDQAQHGEMLAYFKQVLDALGIRWGAAHGEVMLTADGPRLIEVGARTCGGPVLGFSRLATGSSQLERVVEAFVDGRISTRTYDFKQTVVPVFLISPNAGILRNIEVMDFARHLPTHHNTYIWRGNGVRVPRTIDTLTSLGIIALAGDREAVFADYKRIREAEKQLVIE